MREYTQKIVILVICIISGIYAQIQVNQTQEIAVADSPFDLKLAVIKTESNAVTIKFKNAPNAPRADYYFCIQVVLRWHSFKDYCDKFVMASSTKEWISERLDQLDWWNRDYHARVKLCRSTRESMVYCDQFTPYASVITQSQTVMFTTAGPGDKADNMDITWYVLGGLIVCILISLITSQVFMFRQIRYLTKQIEVKNSALNDWKTCYSNDCLIPTEHSVHSLSFRGAEEYDGRSDITSSSGITT